MQKGCVLLERGASPAGCRVVEAFGGRLQRSFEEELLFGYFG